MSKRIGWISFAKAMPQIEWQKVSIGTIEPGGHIHFVGIDHEMDEAPPKI